MKINEIQEAARKYALQNAINFNGKTNLKAVIGKTIAGLKDKDIDPKLIIKVAKSVCEEINNLSKDEQIKQLNKISPELLKKEKKERHFSLPDLPNAKKGKVITRFPPEPNGYLHIGHAKAAIVDYEYAKTYDGKLILRFDDTNPENAEFEFYEAQKKDLKWLGINWDVEYNTSDNLETHYKLAEQLINQGDAYLCNCSSEQIKKGRFKGIECNCRSNDPELNIEIWKKILNLSAENYVLRLKAEMKSVNTAMRDPTLFRIINKPHPLHKDKYNLWPTYDFAGAIEDSISGVTHPFRTKEYELRDECYFYLLDKLKLRKPYLLEFARLSIEGMPVSKRKIKPLIDKGVVLGYDDIRLPTLRGLEKRGIKPKAIKQFIISQGISKVESNVSISLLESENRKLLDPDTKRYFFIKDPIKLIIVNAPKLKKSIRLHPKNQKLGTKKIETNNIFYIPKDDVKNLKIGSIFRLKDLFNVKVKKINEEIHAEYISDELIEDSTKIQWTTEEYIKMEIFIPKKLFINGKFNKNSLEIAKGFAEKEVEKLKTNDIIQFERFGFVRIEKNNNKIVGYFTHK
jgi:glutamyl-tRNA synthetase